MGEGAVEMAEVVLQAFGGRHARGIITASEEGKRHAHASGFACGARSEREKIVVEVGFVGVGTMDESAHVDVVHLQQ